LLYAVQLLDNLERSISSPEFVRQLARSRQCTHTEAGTNELDELLGDYVVVTKADAVAAMAAYIAAWLSTVPEAQNMDPRKLQTAILSGVNVRFSGAYSPSLLDKRWVAAHCLS
jgi:hypothetical protein